MNVAPHPKAVSTLLGDLAAAVPGAVATLPQTQITGIAHDSRRVTPGDLFVAVSGANVRGQAFVNSAIEAGAVAVVTEDALETPIPQLLVANARAALGLLAHRLFGNPTRSLSVIGLTGTNGKTTTAHLVEHMLSFTGERPAVMGTTAFRGPGINEPAPHTTPEGDVVAAFARRCLDAGATHLVMEVSSHGLSLCRVNGVEFDVAAFTNLTQDHLDFHGDLLSYGEAKASLFLDHEPNESVIVVDQPFGRELADRIDQVRPGTCMRCSVTGKPSDIRVTSFSESREGLTAEIEVGQEGMQLKSPLFGAHNLENLLVALGCGVALGKSVQDIADSFETAVGAPGRLERVPHPNDVAVLVDYAHTPDALRGALQALRPITDGRLLVVFGCGGDRDQTKRPKMGQAASIGADLVVVTSDNPRTEDPSDIIAQILPGLASRTRVDGDQLGAADSFCVQVDRKVAIELALSAAEPGDTILIAGKGHEDYQIIGTSKRHFDDREVARSWIAKHLSEARTEH